jgi:UDP:flavonoid glycosyltransferase YjiC (YdhE family)
MSIKPTVLFIVPPASGHVNPIVSIASELKNRSDLDIVFLGTPSFKNLIEKSKSEYVEYDYEDFSDKIQEQMSKGHSPLDAFKYMIEAGEFILPQLLKVDDFFLNIDIYKNVLKKTRKFL